MAAAAILTERQPGEHRSTPLLGQAVIAASTVVTVEGGEAVLPAPA